MMADSMPLLADVDLVVVGGSSGGVACAAAAAQAGRSVYLVAPRSYLGEDIAAAFDYWPEADDEFTGELARRVLPQGADPTATPPIPMFVKRTLEQALIDRGVEFVFNSHAAGVLRDEAGRLAGVVIANRNGRQAIAARSIVDATQRGLVARQAGVAFSAPPAGEQRVRHVTVGGEPIDAAGLAHESLPAMHAPGKEGVIELPAHRYTLSVDLGDGSWSALAAAYAQVVDRCWRPGVWQQSERLGLDWPDHVDGEVRVNDWPGAAGMDVAALAAEPGLWLLSAAAPIGREAARKLARPAHLMGVGERLGARLAKPEPAARTGALTPSCADSEPLPTGEIGMLREGLRPGAEPEATVALPDAALPKLGRYDVVVVGGGTGGAPAGIAAGRAGAKTLVCETGPALGGVGTLGQIAKYYFGNIVGFTSEVDAGVNELEAEQRLREAKGSWSPPAKQTWYLRQCLAAGTEVWFGVSCCGAWVVDGQVRGVVIAGPHGFGLIEAGAVVDGTGNADVAAAAGAPTTGIGDEHVAVQGTGLASLRPDQPYHNTDHSFSDETDLVDASSFFVTSRRKFQSDFDLGQIVDSRERRQIVGEIELGPADFLAGRRFPDSICLSSSNFDSHGFTIHPLFLVKPPDKNRMWVYVPYRCLIPKGIGGVLVTGLGVSAHRDAIPVIRMQPDVQNQGYAAGRAAAMAAQAGVDVRRIDVKDLQRHLVALGNLPENVLTDTDSFPVGDAKLRWAVEEGWDEYEGIALCFAEPARSAPLLREAHDAADETERRQRYALMLALMGDDHGASTLRDALAEREWDAGWNYRGMGQFGMSMSEVDALLVGLGQVGDESAWPVVLEKVRQLDAEPDFSHCRAVAEACERLHARHPNGEAAEAIAALLDQPGLTGHAQTSIAEAEAQLTDNPNENDVRNRALRELHLARGLYRCGDVAGRGESILQRYTQDVRGHFARHARAVLRAAPTPTAVPA